MLQIDDVGDAGNGNNNHVHVVVVCIPVVHF